MDVIGGATPSKQDTSFWSGDIPWVSPKDMKKAIISDSEDHVSDIAVRSTSLRMVPAPAVLIVVRGMILDHTVPIGLTVRDVTINQDMKALCPRAGVVAKFLAYLLRGINRALLARVEEAGHGTKTLRTELWKKIIIPVPPVEEQHRIVRLLDRKAVAIDGLIAKKERLIELLQEKRQTLIAQAVTKGLDSDVPMRESSIRWLGAIPAHWELHHLRRVVSQFVDYRGRTPEKTDSGVPLITAGAFKDGRINHAACPEYVTEAEYRFLIERGPPELDDVLLTTEAPLGEVAMVTESRIALAQRVILFKVNHRRLRSRFLWLHFRSLFGQSELLTNASGSTALGIRADRLKRTRVAVPPLAEQDAILVAVEKYDEQLLPLERAIELQLKKLREYRQALITAAVTGKIDLRAHAPP